MRAAISPSPGGSALRVLIAEDDAMVSLVLGALIRSEPDLELVGAVGDADAAIAAAAEVLPDVAIVDVRMPGGGVRATREIARVSPLTVVYGFSGATDPATVREMMEAGARGYITKGSSPDTILASIRGGSRE